MSSHLSHHPHEAILAQFSLYVHTGGLRDAPLDIWGGGGGACKRFFLPPARKHAFFWRSTSDNFLLCFVEEMKYIFLSYAFSKYVFFLTFLATNYLFQFFSTFPPPPQISNGASLKSHLFHVHFLTIFRREIQIVDNTRHFVTDISRLRPTKACLGAGVRFRA